MKRGGLAILVSGGKPNMKNEEEDDSYEGDESESGTAAAAKEMFAALKDDDEATFVKAFKNACELMRGDD